MALAQAAVVLIREFHTFCFKPGVQRRVGSRTFWPARLTTAEVPVGRPSFSKSCQVMCLTAGIREIVVTSYPSDRRVCAKRLPINPVPPPKTIQYNTLYCNSYHFWKVNYVTPQKPLQGLTCKVFYVVTYLLLHVSEPWRPLSETNSLVLFVHYLIYNLCLYRIE